MDGRANSRESSSSAAAPPKISLPHSLSLSPVVTAGEEGRGGEETDYLV